MDDKNKTPEQILDEIMNRASPPPAYHSSKPEPDSPDPPEDGQPETAAQPDAPAKAKPRPWLWGALGAALLALAVCAALLVNTSKKLNTQESALEENTQLADSLQKENETLQQENKELESELSKAEAVLQELNGRSLQISLMDKQIHQTQCFWFIQQFMEDGDYPMAAVTMMINQEYFFNLPDGVSSPDGEIWLPYPTLNSAQQQRFDEFVAELADRGYLERVFVNGYDSAPRRINYLQSWKREHIEEVNVLSLLWSMLDSYYVSNYPFAPAEWIVRYQTFTSNEIGWDSLSERISETAGDYALQLYRQMVQELTAFEYLVQTEDGYETGNGLDLNHKLPFDFPTVSSTPW